MHRSAFALVGCFALAVAASCGPRPAPVRKVVTPGHLTSPRGKSPPPAVRYKAPVAAGILGTGLVGAGAAGPLALASYADFALDTADLLELAPRYDRPVIAGLLGAGLSGTAAAGPWHQLVYADVAASSFDQLRRRPPVARRGVGLLRARAPLEGSREGHPMYTAGKTTARADRGDAGPAVGKPKGQSTRARTTASRIRGRRRR